MSAFRRSPLLRFARTLVMGLMALAMIGKPVLAELCNVHALSHLGSIATAHVDSAAEARSD